MKISQSNMQVFFDAKESNVTGTAVSKVWNNGVTPTGLFNAREVHDDRSYLPYAVGQRKERDDLYGALMKGVCYGI